MNVSELEGTKLPTVLTDCTQQAVECVFNTIAGSKPEYVGHDEDKKIGDGVVGIISFVGDISWLLMLGFTRESASKIAGIFCGFEIDYDSADMGDVVGELTNVLAGDIISRLRSSDIKVAMSLPTVMRGHDVEPLLPRGTPAKKMHFVLPAGVLMLKVAGSKPGETVGRTPGT